MTATVETGGAFTVNWNTDHIGQFSIRAVLDSSEAQPAAVTQSMTVTVYLPSVASLYGPTLYGHPTACGETLSKQIFGVANKTLPCGEKVALYYHDRTLIVPVIASAPRYSIGPVHAHVWIGCRGSGAGAASAVAGSSVP